METPHAAPEAASGPSPAPRRRWRWVAVLAVVLPVAGIAAALYAATYDPLCRAGCAGPAGVRGPHVEKLGSFDPPAGPRVTAYRLPFQPGRDFLVSFTLSNDGPFPVTIRKLGFLQLGP